MQQTVWSSYLLSDLVTIALLVGQARSDIDASGSAMPSSHLLHMAVDSGHRYSLLHFMQHLQHYILPTVVEASNVLPGVLSLAADASEGLVVIHVGS